MQKFQGSFELTDMDICVWFIATDVDIFWIFCTAKFGHDIFWKVNKDRSRTTCAGDVKCFFDNASEVFSSADCDTVFGDAACDAYDIYFLEGIVSDKVTGYLTGEAYEWNAVIVGGCKTCYKVGCSRTAGYKAYADFACCSRVCIGFVNEGLFVTWEDDFYVVLFVEFIADVDGAGSRVAEEVFYAFFF